MIWIIGGTKDSRILIEKLVKYTNEIVVSIMTEYGKKLVLDYGIKILDVRLSKEEKKEFIQKYDITTIVDASHPYAQNISKTMINMAQECNIGYLRFERPLLSYKGAKVFKSIDSLVEYINNSYKKGNILSTLGTRNLLDLKNIKYQDNLIIRILPVLDSIKKAEELGFLAKNILAIQGPFSKAFNKVIIQNYNINYLLTKESGKEGGELEKILAARETNTEVLVLKRPIIEYPNIVGNINDVINYLKKKPFIKEFK